MLQAVILIYRKSNRHQSTRNRYQQMAKGKSAILSMAQLFPVSESFTALISVCVVQLPYVEFEPLLVAARGVSGHVIQSSSVSKKLVIRNPALARGRN